MLMTRLRACVRLSRRLGERSANDGSGAARDQLRDNPNRIGRLPPHVQVRAHAVAA
jgi:hypothetical protein